MEVSKMFDDLKKVQEGIVKLQKGAKNPFFKSKYVELNQVLEVVKPVLHENNFILLQLPQHVKETGKNTLKTILLHSSGKEIVSEIELVCVDRNDPQKLGGAITYMRRYSIISMLGLEQEDDDGNNASQPTLASDKQLSFIRRLATEKGVDITTIVKEYNLGALPKATATQASEIIERLTKKENV
jgi:hypothetical protein